MPFTIDFDCAVVYARLYVLSCLKENKTKKIKNNEHTVIRHIGTSVRLFLLQMLKMFFGDADRTIACKS